MLLELGFAKGRSKPLAASPHCEGEVCIARYVLDDCGGESPPGRLARVGECELPIRGA